MTQVSWSLRQDSSAANVEAADGWTPLQLGQSSLASRGAWPQAFRQPRWFPSCRGCPCGVWCLRAFRGQGVIHLAFLSILKLS